MFIRPLKKMAAFSLIEMVMTLVILAIITSAITSAFVINTTHSSDPQIISQGVYIANAYLEEIMLKDFTDPDGGELYTAGAEAGETRVNYDDIYDYHNLSDTTGAVFPGASTPNVVGLEKYNISVSVDTANISTLNSIALQPITVTVTHDTFPLNITLTTYRTNYP